MDNLKRLSEALNEAALFPQRWADAQLVLQKYFGAFSSQLASVDHSAGNQFWSRTSGIPEIDQELLAIAPLSEPVRFAVKHPRWRVMCDYDYIDEKGMERSEFYRHNAQFEICYRMIIRLLDTPQRSDALVLLWRKQDGHVQRSHLDKLAGVHEQMRLAATISSRMSADLTSEATLVDALETAHCAAIIIDSDGKVVLQNALACSLFARRKGITIVSGEVHISHSAARGEFSRGIAAAANDHVSSRETIVSIPSPTGNLPVFAIARALPRKHQVFGPTRTLFLVLLHDPVRKAVPAAAVLSRAFGLSPSETLIAQALAAGQTPGEVARNRGTRLGTVRQQVKTIMGKLDVHRQADLVRILSKLPGA